MRSDGPSVNVFDLNRRIIGQHVVVLTPAQSIVAALWELNTYVYDCFEHAPELGISTASRGLTANARREPRDIK